MEGLPNLVQSFIKENMSIKTILSQEIISEGKSGALVFRIKVESSIQERSGWYFVKCTNSSNEWHDHNNDEATKRKKADFHSPKFKYRFAEMVMDGVVDGWNVIILKQANDRAQGSVSLIKLKDINKFSSVLKQISYELLEEWNTNPTSDGNIQSFFENILAYRMGRDGVFIKKLKEIGIDSNKATLNLGDKYYPNPAYFIVLNSPLLWNKINGQSQLQFYKGNIHGDLHCDNIICDCDNDPIEYCIIDHDSYSSDGYLLFDHAYLELYCYLFKNEYKEEISAEEWINQVAPYIVTNTLAAVENDCNRWNRAVRNSICEGIKKWADKHHPGLIEDVEMQFRLARIAAGINFFSKRAIIDETIIRKLLYYICENILCLFTRIGLIWDHRCVTYIGEKSIVPFNESQIEVITDTNPSIEDKEREFEEYIISKLCDASFAGDYLKSGLSSELNLGSRLTPRLFEKYFLIKRNKTETEEISSTISRLFRSDSFNMLCIEAGRGSGKSTFVNTTLLSTDKEYEFVYPHPCFDLTKRRVGNEYCECGILSEFESVYNNLLKDTTWKQKYFSEIQRISITANDFGGYFRKNLDRSVNALLNNSFKTLFFDHAERIRASSDDTIDIKIFLLLYLVALATKPQPKSNKETKNRKKPIRWIMLFDGIETYVTADAEKAIRTIFEIHDFVRNAFDSVGMVRDFFTKFTFIIPVRTATSLNIEQAVDSSGRKIWGNHKEYIIKLPQTDFSIEALLKKIKYLTSIKRDTSEQEYPLIKRCIEIVSVLIPRPLIQSYINGHIKLNEITEKARFFAERKLLPLFNYDHRNIVDKLYEFAALDASDPNIQALSRLDENLNNENIDSNIVSNGKHMIFLRSIFNVFRRYGLLNQIGYSDFDYMHQHGIARTLLNFLYYRELKFRLDCIRNSQIDAGGEFAGVPFIEFLDMLKPFAQTDITQLANIVYNISALNAATDPVYTWSHLLIIRGIEKRLSIESFDLLIRNYYQDNNREHMSNWYVKLSDAGLSFSSWASKQFEFLLSRCDTGSTALFAKDIINDVAIKDSCDRVKDIINKEGITRLIENAIIGCKYCKNNALPCKTCDTINNDKTAMDCSLIQRYQECLLLIVESIDYIDRFRCYIYQVGKANNLPNNILKERNNMLLDVITGFNALFDELESKIISNVDENMGFLDKMNKNTRKYWRLSEDNIRNVDFLNSKGKKYIQRIRTPRFHRWYLYPPAHMHLVIGISRFIEEAVPLFDMNKRIQIVRNRIKCNVCNEIIESNLENREEKCECKSCMISGGHKSLIRNGKIKDWQEMSEVIYDNKEFAFVNGKWIQH